MNIVECVAYREQLLIVIFALIIGLLILMQYLERRNWRKQIFVVSPSPTDEYPSGRGGGASEN